jgi:hypothetical protein
MHIAHIVNVVDVPDHSDLKRAQPVTFDTMRQAAGLAAEDGLRLKLREGRKLPLVKDILDRLYTSATDADVLVYTNVDIALQPHFYNLVSQYVDNGVDAFVINRRTVTKSAGSGSIPMMAAEVGAPHPGYDCFVFRRELLPHFWLGETCVGVPGIGKVLIANLIAHSRHFELFPDLHITFHLGDDQSWNLEGTDVYRQHNLKQLVKLMSKVAGKGEPNPIFEECRRVAKNFESGILPNDGGQHRAVPPTLRRRFVWRWNMMLDRLKLEYRPHG